MGSVAIDSAEARRWDARGFVWAAVLAALATGIGWPLHHGLKLDNSSVLMLYLLVVLWVATRHSRGAAILASLLGVALFDFFFVKPYLRFSVDEPQYLFTFAAMLMTALVIGTLTHRLREHARIAVQRERRTAQLAVERAQLAEEARQAWELAEAEILRNTLLSGVSHELRTPLAAITGAVTTLIESGERLDDNGRKEMLDTVFAGAERMERLISNLLDMTRMEAGGLALKKEWLPLAEVVGSSLNHLRRRLEGRMVKTSLAADLPLVQIDDVALEQVLSNLVDNAVEYTPVDSPIEIAARAENGQIVVEVSDRGPGLPPGMETRIFEKFVRMHQNQARRGIGLGLAIARGIVEAHGGKIWASNRADGGAVFSFTLPVTGNAPAIDTSA